jgi:hypothetical protein
MLSDETQVSAVSWAAVAAGAVATAALTLLLLAFGAGRSELCAIDHKRG